MTPLLLRLFTGLIVPVFTGVVLVLTISPTLVLGVYRNGKLRYFGRPGTGFREKGMRETIDRLAALPTDKQYTV